MYKVGIVGTGMMGSSIAALLLGYGHEVVVIGRSDESCVKCRNSINSIFNELISGELISQSFKEECLSQLKIVMDYNEINDADFIFEAVVERISDKTSVYKLIEQHCKESTPIISSTSGIVADDLVGGIKIKERFIVAHFWNPAHLIPLVEVLESKYTNERTLKATLELLNNIERKVILLKKAIPGFIGNRIMHAMYREALYLVEQGVATPQEIDDTILYSFGQRFSSVGLLEYYDSCGLDLQYDVQSYLLSDLSNSKEPQKILMDCYNKGNLGPKTGKGIYDWSKIDFSDFQRRKSAPFYKYFNWNHKNKA